MLDERVALLRQRRREREPLAEIRQSSRGQAHNLGEEHAQGVDHGGIRGVGRRRGRPGGRIDGLTVRRLLPRSQHIANESLRERLGVGAPHGQPRLCLTGARRGGGALERGGEGGDVIALIRPHRPARGAPAGSPRKILAIRRRLGDGGDGEGSLAPHRGGHSWRRRAVRAAPGYRRERRRGGSPRREMTALGGSHETKQRRTLAPRQRLHDRLLQRVEVLLHLPGHGGVRADEGFDDGAHVEGVEAE